MPELIVIGGGLAGCEAAWQAANLGIKVTVFEMRPVKFTEAHKTDMLAELVCSNSLKSLEPTSASGLLKKELELANSLIMQAALQAQIPAGLALAVDRAQFALLVTKKIQSHPNIKLIREEVTTLPDKPSIIATGPLTSLSLTKALQTATGTEGLYFYDAIAPIVDAQSIDYTQVFSASRYGKGGDDYLNCPMSKPEYEAFYDALIQADVVVAREFENARFFEGCMPIEVMARRGKDTLRFGPLKPVGLIDPKSKQMPYAVVQLRAENSQKTAYNLVGFQTRLRQPEQARVFRQIPALRNAEFLRYGSIHRNTYINSPALLNPDLTLKSRPHIYLAGQITGVEGYLESTACGLLAGIFASLRLRNIDFELPSAETAHGALLKHVSRPTEFGFSPSNINFALIEVDDKTLAIKDKAKRRELICQNALAKWRLYLSRLSLGVCKR